MTARSEHLKAEAAAMHAVEMALDRATALLDAGGRGRVLRYAQELVTERLDHHAALSRVEQHVPPKGNTGKDDEL